MAAYKIRGWTALVLQAIPTSPKSEGCGALHTQAMSCHIVWCGPITFSALSHDTLHQCLSSNNGLENGDRKLGHFSATTGAVKALWLYFSEKVHSSQQVFQECCVWNLVTVEFLIIRTPLIIIHVKMKLLFIQQKRKHSETVFLMSRSESKRVLLALALVPTARDAVKAGVLTRSRKLCPSHCRARLISVHVTTLATQV